MEQPDGTIVVATNDLAEGVIVGPLFVGSPILVGEAPVHGGVAKALGHGQGAGGVFTLGRAEQGHSIAEMLDHVVMQAQDLALHLGDVQCGHGDVVDAVIANGVTFVDHPAHQIRLALDIPHSHEKGGLHILLLQHIQDPLGDPVGTGGIGGSKFIAAVKGQIVALIIGADKGDAVLAVGVLVVLGRSGTGTVDGDTGAVAISVVLQSKEGIAAVGMYGGGSRLGRFGSLSAFLGRLGALLGGFRTFFRRLRGLLRGVGRLLGRLGAFQGGLTAAVGGFGIQNDPEKIVEAAAAEGYARQQQYQRQQKNRDSFAHNFHSFVL